MIMVLLLFSNMLLLASAYATSNQTKIPTYMVTTRGNSGPPMPMQGSGYHGNHNFSNIDTLLQTCPHPEMAIFVHGWNVSSDAAKEKLDSEGVLGK
jgi:hypothetical protein